MIIFSNMKCNMTYDEFETMIIIIVPKRRLNNFILLLKVYI